MGGLLGPARVGRSGQRAAAPRATGDGHRPVSWVGGGGAPLKSCGAGALGGRGVAYPRDPLVGAARLCSCACPRRWARHTGVPEVPPLHALPHSFTANHGA